MRAAPATIGGMPRSSKRASERQSATRSRSPCTTWIAIAVWPSLKVVKSCARAVGIGAVARRRCARPGRPWSRCPSDSGITSSSSRSPAPALPASGLAWMRGAQRHHLVRVRGWSAARGRRTRRPRAAPAACGSSRRPAPRPRSSSLSTLASRSALRTAAMVRSTNGRAIASNSRAIDGDATPARRRRVQANGARSASDSASLAARAAIAARRACRRRCRRCTPACASTQSASARSIVVAAERRVAAGGDHLEHAAASAAGARCRRCRRPGRRPRRGLRCALSRP